VKREDGTWVATSHAAVSTVLRAPGWSSDHRRATVELPEIAGSLLSKVLLFMDAPDHTRVRALVGKAFHPRAVEQLRPRMAALTAELLAPLQAAGGFDVIEDVAFPLPVTVICELLGVPADDRDLLRGFTREMAGILELDPTPAPAARC
jgi:cytochrome P450